ncbi:hypothetical protein SSX86_028276 [Deinandra increscens subsp. villosa]|uniref:Dof-type domain-containing protein n=1 Tax=Deinandra increscens subsp. villosa TaxID=3103831 RepID=A0AAP0CAH8_9ASTR
MADVHKGHDLTRFKLFGTMINVRELKEEPLSKSDDQVDDNDNQTLGNIKRPENIIPCPRCKSMETKFCYFNNYNVKQPRHFCKGCQRYWTAGGALRNVPVGAGRRKAKPPCGYGVVGDGFSDVLFLDDNTSNCGNQFDGMVEWHMEAHGSFQHLFPAKRRRPSIGDF